MRRAPSTDGSASSCASENAMMSRAPDPAAYAARRPRASVPGKRTPRFDLSAPTWSTRISVRLLHDRIENIHVRFCYIIPRMVERNTGKPLREIRVPVIVAQYLELCGDVLDIPWVHHHG